MAAADSNVNAVLSLDEIQRHRATFTKALTAPNTQRGYRFDWTAFRVWCDSMRLTSLPATGETLTLYVTARLAAGRKVSTVKRNLAAIEAVHSIAGYPRPDGENAREILRGAQRLRIETVHQVRPIAIGDLREISALLLAEDTPVAVRNRAIVLAGFASALRCANLVLLNLGDVEFTEHGAVLHITREKQDQEGVGRLIGLPHGKHPETCPVRALRAWIERRGSFPGPLFTRFDGHPKGALQAERICQIVQQCLKRIGREWRAYGGHSLRAGFVTEAGEQGAGELLIAAQTGHRSMATLRRYFRRQDLFRTNAFAVLDL